MQGVASDLASQARFGGKPRDGGVDGVQLKTKLKEMAHVGLSITATVA